MSGDRPAAPRGRLAPSPTGEVHLGNASTALLAWLSVRARGGAVVMRVEDLDPARSRPELAHGVLRDTAWLGLDWDEGPDVGGPYGPYEQSRRGALYGDAFRRLVAAGRVYPCFCSRRDIAAAASAPQMPGDEIRYPAICRNLDPEASRARVARGDRHAWRYRVDPDERRSFDDLVWGRREGAATEPPGDFVVRRSDGVPAYQLAVVVDDAAMRIDEVVRGDDLLASTERQLLLYGALGWPPPRFGHVPLLLDAGRVRLSKRQRGITLRELREAGHSPERVVGRLAALVGLWSCAAPVTPRELLDGFSLAALPRFPDGIVVD